MLSVLGRAAAAVVIRVELVVMRVASWCSVLSYLALQFLPALEVLGICCS